MRSNTDLITLRKFGKHLKALRKAQKLSFRELSAKSKVSTGDLVRYENGEAGPTLVTLQKLAAGLGVRTGELVEFSDGKGVLDNLILSCSASCILLM